MLIKRAAIPAISIALFGLVSAGWIHGGFKSQPTTFQGANWHDVLKQVPCNLVAKVGQDFKINAILVVGGLTFTDPIISEQGQLNEIEHKCFPKH